MTCPYHTAHCAHAGIIADRYLVRMSGIYADEFPFEFADRAEYFAIHQQTRGVKVEVIDTVTTKTIVVYDHSTSAGGTGKTSPNQAGLPVPPPAADLQRSTEEPERPFPPRSPASHSTAA